MNRTLIAVTTCAAAVGLLTGCGGGDKSSTATPAASSSAEATLKVVSTSAPATASAQSYGSPTLLVADLAARGVSCLGLKTTSTRAAEQVAECQVLEEDRFFDVSVYVYPSVAKGTESFSTWRSWTAAGQSVDDVTGGANWVVKCSPGASVRPNGVCQRIQKALGGTYAPRQ